MTTEKQVEALLAEGDTEETLGGFSIEIRRQRIQREREARKLEFTPFPEGALREAAELIRSIFLRIQREYSERLSSADCRDFTCWLHPHGRGHDFFDANVLEDQGWRIGIKPRGGFKIVSDRASAPTETDLQTLIRRGEIPVCVGKGPFSKPGREDENHSVVLNTLKLLGLDQDPVWCRLGAWQHSVFSRGGPGNWTRTLGMVRTVSLGHMADQPAVYRFNKSMLDAIRAEIEAELANPKFKQLRASLIDQTAELGLWLGIEQHPIWQKLLESPNSSGNWENTLGVITTLSLALSNELELARLYVGMILDSVQAEIEEEEAARAELPNIDVNNEPILHNSHPIKMGIVQTAAVLISREARRQGIGVLVRKDPISGHAIISAGRDIDLSKVAARLRAKEAELTGQCYSGPLTGIGLIGPEDNWFYKRGQRAGQFESLINGGFTHPGMQPTAMSLDELGFEVFVGLVGE